MITAKFGGTALTPHNLAYLKQCVGPLHKCVVVSAVGKEFSGDVKVTDLLKQYYLSRNEALWDTVADKYRRLVEVNGVAIDVDKILSDAHARALNYNLDYCMSLGEELAAKVTARYLDAVYVEAEQIVRFSVRTLAFKATMESMRSAFDGVGLVVTGGFYGGVNNTRRTFTRGGGDITGALCAVATDSTLYENWTDSYGVCVANPAKVFDVATVHSLSYDEMFALANAGAEVLHPDAVKPCKQSAIPVKIGNFYNPYGDSTLISNCPSRCRVLSIAERNDEQGNTVTTVLHSLPQSELHRLFYGYFRNNLRCHSEFCKTYYTEQTQVIRFARDGSSATVVTNKSILRSLYKYFKSANCFD